MKTDAVQVLWNVFKLLLKYETTGKHKESVFSCFTLYLEKKFMLEGNTVYGILELRLMELTKQAVV